MLSVVPVNRLSTQITLLPRCSKASQRCDPIKPAPPAIKTVAELRGALMRVWNVMALSFQNSATCTGRISDNLLALRRRRASASR